MANKNDFNYYKNEYGKYKDSYYTPGSEESKQKKSNKTKRSFSRFIRAFFVFLIIFAVIAAIVYGIFKLSDKIDFSSKKETTTVIDESTTKSIEKDKTTEKETAKPAGYVAGAKGVVSTNDKNGVYLRTSATYDVSGFTHIDEGTKVVIDEISDDEQWCKTKNFDVNGWINVKYIKLDEDINDTSNKTTDKETTTKKTTTTTSTDKTTANKTTTTKKVTTSKKVTTTSKDGKVSSYSDAVKAFANKGSGAKMNCKIKSNGKLYAKYKPDTSSANILRLENGDSVVVTAVSGSYSKVYKYNAYAWVPNENLTFVSWG